MGAGTRLVSVLGLGGTGKTRLVTRFGWNSLGEFPGGIWFCDLSEARSVDGILHAVAQGLDVPLGKDDPVIQVGYAIAGRGKCL
jgi:predicted ATPase